MTNKWRITITKYSDQWRKSNSRCMTLTWPLLRCYDPKLTPPPKKVPKWITINRTLSPTLMISHWYLWGKGILRVLKQLAHVAPMWSLMPNAWTLHMTNNPNQRKSNDLVIPCTYEKKLWIQEFKTLLIDSYLQRPYTDVWSSIQLSPLQWSYVTYISRATVVLYLHTGLVSAVKYRGWWGNSPPDIYNFLGGIWNFLGGLLYCMIINIRAGNKVWPFGLCIWQYQGHEVAGAPRPNTMCSHLSTVWQSVFNLALILNTKVTRS